ncbi:MAG: hypothetical protein ACRD1O_06860, partial [Terriglobia bacterium]
AQSDSNRSESAQDDKRRACSERSEGAQHDISLGCGLAALRLLEISCLMRLMGLLRVIWSC